MKSYFIIAVLNKLFDVFRRFLEHQYSLNLILSKRYFFHKKTAVFLAITISLLLSLFSNPFRGRKDSEIVREKKFKDHSLFFIKQNVAQVCFTSNTSKDELLLLKRLS